MIAHSARTSLVLLSLSLRSMLAPLPSSAQSLTDSRAALQLLIHQQETAWNHGDGAGFAAAFTDDADFVNIRGDIFHGRAMIGARHTVLLSGPFKGSHVTIALRQFTEIAPDVVVLETNHTLTNYRSLPPGIVPTSLGVLKTRMKYIATKQAGQWRFVAAQNTAVSPTALAPSK